MIMESIIIYPPVSLYTLNTIGMRSRVTSDTIKHIIIYIYPAIYGYIIILICNKGTMRMNSYAFTVTCCVT